MLSVDVLPVLPLARVRARVDVEGSWILAGASGEDTWQVAEGEGPRWLSDPWAPLNQAVTYTLTAGGESWTVGPVARTFGGWHVVTDLRGGDMAEFLWEKSGGDPWERAPRHQFFDVPGRRLGPYMSAPVAGAGGGSLTARTVRESTAAMRRLVDANAAVVVLHNEARCQRAYCDVPLVRTVLLTGAPENVTDRLDEAERTWALSYQYVPAPWGYVPPVAKLSEPTPRWPTVGDLAASGLTVGELAAGDWLVA